MSTVNRPPFLGASTWIRAALVGIATRFRCHPGHQDPSQVLRATRAGADLSSELHLQRPTDMVSDTGDLGLRIIALHGALAVHVQVAVAIQV